MKKNVIVGQSGGPTAVINASLAGVYKTAKDMGADTIYGMRYGIQGLLEKKIVDLGEKIRNDMDVELLKRTPASFLGSCRYKLPESSEDKAIYEKILKTI
jgi:6-phosphofructokinase 1